MVFLGTVKPKFALMVVVVVATTIAGCLDPQEVEESSSQSLPTVTPSGGHHPTNEPPILTTRGLGANFTDCQGSQVVFDVPSDWVADDVSENYTVRGTFPGTAVSSLRLNACQKAALDGIDVGSASFTILHVLINEPANSNAPDEVETYFYALEIRTDNPHIAEWLRRQGVPVGNGTVTHSFTDLPDPYFGELRSELKDTESLYQVHAVTTNPVVSTNENVRNFYGPNPALDYFDETVVWLRGDSYPGEVQASENSQLAKVFGHPLPASPFVTAMASLQRVIEPGPRATS